jgi:hypothetical protein
VAATARRDLANDVALELHRDEYDLAVRGLGHGLQRLELADLHRGGTRENVGGLTHEARRVHFGTCGDDFGFSDTLLLGSGREGLGDFGGEDDVFDAEFFRSAKSAQVRVGTLTGCPIFV